MQKQVYLRFPTPATSFNYVTAHVKEQIYVSKSHLAVFARVIRILSTIGY